MPDHSVLVAPRYLAGAINDPQQPLNPLLAAAWPSHDDEVGNLHLTSPDARIRVGYVPEPGTLASLWQPVDLWHITAHDHPYESPKWTARFTADVPEEIVAALTQVLAEQYARADDRLLRPLGGKQDAVAPLIDAGWTMHGTPGTDRQLDLTAPDGLAALHADTNGRTDAWVVTVRSDRAVDLTGAGWSARFSQAIPPQLLAAITGAVVDRAPVRRTEHQIPLAFRGAAHLTPAASNNAAAAAAATSPHLSSQASAAAEPNPPTPEATPTRSHRR
ncbi:hypothetical protein BIV57_19175 [Mangrovactinospora gilvigrisea]|uniref:DUF317 domain-containing protein n=1 Tax=Mangrovactinospora gilvigrisea TaxID=1428644 RepID=A0A1J7C2P8_9ACTN|nr:DUF317 domain-containing protein [Mangrovactinospora gilvigrisea]OIV35844.1 hypothetical protein BIV57_19175 [Mangrovactinospora gilvigrisea]